MPQVVSNRILVVDDNPDAAKSMAMVLSLDGHDVRATHDGPSTLNTACTFQPQVVFLDIGMPGMDGYETAIRLRRLPGLEDALVVAVTGYGRETSHPRVKEARFDHYLTKPLQFEGVRQLIAGQRTTTPEADVVRVRQIVLDDLQEAESALAALQKSAPDAERGMQLTAIRSAIAELLRVTGGGPR
jgi:CheY-like chemotaxis protein